MTFDFKPIAIPPPKDKANNQSMLRAKFALDELTGANGKDSPMRAVRLGEVQEALGQLGAPRLPPFALTQLPSASGNPGAVIFVTGLTGGNEPCFSDGVNWRRMSDKTVAN